MSIEVVIACLGLAVNTLQALAVGIGLFFTVRQLKYNAEQLKSAADSLEETKRSLRVSVHNATAEAVNSINEFIAANADLQAAAGESPSELLAHVRFNRFEQVHALWREGFLDEQALECTKAWIADSMKKPEMQGSWKTCRRYYRADFCDWVDSLTTTLPE